MIEKISKLAMLNLSQEELREFEEEFKKILEFINKLKEVDVEGVEPFLLQEKTPLREDKESEPLPKERVFLNAPKREGDFFVVPKTF